MKITSKAGTAPAIRPFVKPDILVTDSRKWPTQSERNKETPLFGSVWMLDKWVIEREVPLEDLMSPSKVVENKQS
jgi:hypothetical protein